MSGDLESATPVNPGEWATGSDERASIAARDLAAVSVTRETNIELLVVEEQQAVG